MGLDRFRNAHGTGALALARVEMPLEEVRPVHEPAQVGAGRERDAAGKWVKGARHDQRKGGLAKRDLADVAADIDLALASLSAERRANARKWIRAQRMQLASRVGGGELGPGPTRTIVQAALQHEKALEAFAAGNSAVGSKLLNDSSQSLSKSYVMAAHEARHAPKGDPLAALNARLDAIAATTPPEESE